MQGSTIQEGTICYKNRRKFGIQGFLFAIIPLCGFIFFCLFPIGYSIFLSFTDLSSSTQLIGNVDVVINFIGFENYINVFNNMRFWHSVAVAFYVTLGQFMSLTVALCMSALLSSKVKGWNLFSVLYFIPYICSSVAMAMIWQKMFDYQRGIINELLISLGSITAETKINWMQEADVYMIIFLFVTAWHAPGYGIIMYNAAFSAIDSTLYEAAKIDGASRIKQFTSITMPAISHTTYFLVMLGFISGLQQFEIFQVFTGLGGSWTGQFGPDDMGLVPLLYIYSIKDLDMGSSSAMSWFMFFIVFGVSKLNERFQHVWVANENE